MSIAFEKAGILPEKMKILTSSNHRLIENFLLNFCTRFPLNNVYKSVLGIF